MAYDSVHAIIDHTGDHVGDQFLCIVCIIVGFTASWWILGGDNVRWTDFGKCICFFGDGAESGVVYGVLTGHVWDGHPLKMAPNLSAGPEEDTRRLPIEDHLSNGGRFVQD